MGGQHGEQRPSPVRQGDPSRGTRPSPGTACDRRLAVTTVLAARAILAVAIILAVATILAGARNGGEFCHGHAGRVPRRADLPGIVRGTLAADQRRAPVPDPADRYFERLLIAGRGVDTGPVILHCFDGL